MPVIDINQLKTKKPFKKKAYRPWSLMDEMDEKDAENTLDPSLNSEDSTPYSAPKTLQNEAENTLVSPSKEEVLNQNTLKKIPLQEVKIHQNQNKTPLKKETKGSLKDPFTPLKREDIPLLYPSFPPLKNSDFNIRNGFFLSPQNDTFLTKSFLFCLSEIALKTPQKRGVFTPQKPLFLPLKKGCFYPPKNPVFTPIFTSKWIYTKNENFYKSLYKSKANPSENGLFDLKNELDINKISIRYQLDINKISIRYQLDINKISIRYQLDINEPEFESLLLRFRALFLLQKKVVFFVGKNCIDNGTFFTDPLTIEDLEDGIKSDGNSIKCAIFRLIEKGFFKREFGKRGKGGYSIFAISQLLKDVIYYEENWSENKLFKPAEKNQLDIKNSKLTKYIYNYINKNNNINIYNNLTTTNFDINTGKSLEYARWGAWELVDITPLERIEFSMVHVRQIFDQGKLTCKDLQDSIYAFAFDLDNNLRSKVFKVGPLSYFMGILKRGLVYAYPDGYDSPLEKALEEYIHRQEEIQRKRGERLEEALELSFVNWERSLSEDEVCKILPEKNFRDNYPEIRKSCLKDYFKKHIWPERMKEFGLGAE
jgi:hypothetical protein